MLEHRYEIAQNGATEAILSRLEETIEPGVYERVELIRSGPGASIAGILERVMSEAVAIADPASTRGARLDIQPGIYKLERPITFADTVSTGSGILSVPLTIRGASGTREGASVIRASISDIGTFWTLRNCRSMSFEELTFEEFNDELAPVDVFALDMCADIKFKGCTFSKVSGSAIKCESRLSTRVSVEDCTFLETGLISATASSGYPAVDLSLVHDVSIRGCVVRDSGGGGIHLNAVGNLQVHENLIQRCGADSTGLHVENSLALDLLTDTTDLHFADGALTNNVIESNAGNGLDVRTGLSQVLRLTVANNTLSHNKLYGLWINSAEGIFCANNINGNELGGIRVEHATSQTRNISIYGNTIGGNGVWSDPSVEDDEDDETPANLAANVGISFGTPFDIDRPYEGVQVKVHNNILSCGDIQRYGITFDALVDRTKRYYQPGFEIASNTIINSSEKGVLFSTVELVDADFKSESRYIRGVLRENQGYVTENCGFGEVPRREKSIVVEHGLQFPVAPPLEGFSISPVSDIMGKSTFLKNNSYRIDNATATTFTVSIRHKIRRGFDFNWAFRLPNHWILDS